ncbi:MAG: DUF2782 domain-containing protein [Methylococcales bacterium]|nr:DUF2782 domain-containing protein [Methylococcales bacterium]MBT7408665.1 DUF2782 domain-containing protein [Methylococcales bacterium]
MKYPLKIVAIISLVLFSNVNIVNAETPPPPTPLKYYDEQVEPEVTIIQNDQGYIEEYRQNGILYMVKITPKQGIPYYLVDIDGDGFLETRRSAIEPPAVQQWPIFSW